MEDKKIPIKNIYLLLTICLGLVALGIGSTYAVFTAESEIKSPISLASKLVYDSSLAETISIDIPAGETVTQTIVVNNTTEDTLNYVIYYINQNIDMESGTSSGSPTGSLASGVSATVEVQVRNNTDSDVTIILGILSSTDSVVLGSSMVMVPSEELKTPVNLVTHISNLYTNATKTEVTNNSIVYNYASDVSLMNDRLGGTTEDYDAGNIRYYGASPSNYIYYNCETYPETNCEKWRIIGVFKDIEVVQEDGTRVAQDLVKIIRDDSIGTYAWDNKLSGIGTSTSSYGSNDWTDARLMMLLNDGYEAGYTNDEGDEIYGYEGSLYWNSKSGTCYSGSSSGTTTCDFTSTGLKNDTTTNMIEEVVWPLLGWNSSSVYSNAMYNYERTTGKVYNTSIATEWEGKVALMYPSDYGYATDFNKCSVALGSYNSSTDSYACRTNDWLFKTSTTQWVLTPYSSNADAAWYVSSSGNVNDSNGVYRASAVRPVLYLNSELSIESGEGTSTSPYRISVSEFVEW